MKLRRRWHVGSRDPTYRSGVRFRDTVDARPRSITGFDHDTRTREKVQPTSQGTHPMVKMMATLLLVLLVASGELAAQNSLGVVVRADQWTINSGHLASPQTRPGVAVGLASWGSTGVARAVVGWVSEGDVRPGWMSVGVEGGPRLMVEERLGIGVQLNVAGLDMKADNRREAFRDCRPEDGCLLEAPGYRNGWGLLAGGSVVGSLVPWDRLELMGEYGWNRIWAGANEEEVLRKWSLGAQLRIR